MCVSWVSFGESSPANKNKELEKSSTAIQILVGAASVFDHLWRIAHGRVIAAPWELHLDSELASAVMLSPILMLTGSTRRRAGGILIIADPFF